MIRKPNCYWSFSKISNLNLKNICKMKNENKMKNPTELFRSTINAVYKHTIESTKDAPTDLTLKELVEVMVNKERLDSTISNERMAMDIYSTCVSALLNDQYCFRLLLNKDGVNIGINNGTEQDVYL